MSGSNGTPAETMRSFDSRGGEHRYDAHRLSWSIPRNGGSALRACDTRMGSSVSETESRNGNPGPLPRGRECSSGSGSANGSPFGPLGRGASAHGPAFDAQVPPGGYIWWYLDAISDCGEHALTVIAFVGSAFSPYYAATSWRNPLDHCALNIALYGKHARWTMTERGAADVRREAKQIRIGPSALRWDHDCLRFDLHEVGAPLPRRVSGSISVYPEAFTSTAFAIGPDNQHVWQPIAPQARIEVRLTAPALTWRGTAYLDSNYGSAPLQDAFSSWRWFRAHTPEGSVIYYDTTSTSGGCAQLALSIPKSGTLHTAALPPDRLLPTTLWRLPRIAWGEDASTALITTLEDTPFYSRSLVRTKVTGQKAVGFHEYLDLRRLRSPLIRAMLPFRMPRRRG